MKTAIATLVLLFLSSQALSAVNNSITQGNLEERLKSQMRIALDQNTSIMEAEIIFKNVIRHLENSNIDDSDLIAMVNKFSQSIVNGEEILSERETTIIKNLSNR